MASNPPRRRAIWRPAGASVAILIVIASTVRADPLPGARWTAVDLQDSKSGSARWQPGRVTVFSFFAYWCDTWKAQTPRLRSAARTLKGLPIDLFAVSVDGRWKEVGDGGLDLRIDPGGDWSRGTGVDRVPTTVVVGSDGVVRWVRSGVVRTEDVVREAKLALSEPSAGEVYLTFDDFPPASGGDEFLDLLRSLNVRATLFCVGERVEASAKLLKRAIEEGHTLGCHSWDHDGRRPQIERCHEAFLKFLGSDFSLSRMPGSEKIMPNTTSRPIVDPFDYLRPGKAELVRRCLLAVRPGAVIQLHAGVSDTAEALPEVVSSIRNRGYSFANLK